jgi:hypothetical protein
MPCRETATKQEVPGQPLDLPFRLHGLGARTALEHLRQSFLHLAFPLADLGRMDLILSGDLGHRLAPNDRFQSHLGFECGTVSFPFCFHVDVCGCLFPAPSLREGAGQQTPKSLT